MFTDTMSESDKDVKNKGKVIDWKEVLKRHKEKMEAKEKGEIVKK